MHRDVSMEESYADRRGSLREEVPEMKKANSLKVILILIAAILPSIPIQASSVNHTKPAGDAQTDEALNHDKSMLSGLKKGKALKKGDCIGITAPAYYIKDNDFNQAVMFLRILGYKVKVTKSCTSRYRYFAGSDRQRAKDLNELFEDDSVDAILCLRGGYGCARILDYLDYEMIAEHPKLLIGFSDVTALHISLMEKCGLSTVCGPMLSSFKDIYSQYITQLFQNESVTEQLLENSDLPWNGVIDLNEASFDDTDLAYTVSQFQSGLTSNKPLGDIALPEGEELHTLIPGSAKGVIIGGNLTVIASLIGTEYELQGEHALLFIEEVGEKAYRIDRMLQQLYQSGLFDRVDGILIGEMTDNQDDETCTVEQVLKEYARLAGKPCITGVPSGHDKNNMFLPFGVMAEMTANKDGSASLTFLESALR